MAKMIRRTCAFCPEDEEMAIMYIAKEQNLAAHQECVAVWTLNCCLDVVVEWTRANRLKLNPGKTEVLFLGGSPDGYSVGRYEHIIPILARLHWLPVASRIRFKLYSSGFVESEEYNHDNVDTRFDLASVLSEMKRGRRLICNFCRKRGATVGCEIKTCRRSYHYFCALCDDAAVEKDEAKGIYRLFCSNHDPVKKNNFSDEDDKRVLKKSAARNKMSKQDTSEDNLKVLKEKQAQHKVRIDFVRKCKQAGLLDELFEEMLDTLHLAQEKLMSDQTSEAEYEETVISLFDCGIFENILAAVHSGTEEKIQELISTRKRLDTQIKLLKDLKEVVLPTQEGTANASNGL